MSKSNNLYLVHCNIFAYIANNQDGIDQNTEVNFYIAATNQKIAKAAAKNLLETYKNKNGRLKNDKLVRVTVGRAEKLGTVYQT